MPEIKFSDIQEKQQQLMKMAEELMHEKDGNVILEKAPAVQKCGEELQEMANEFERQQKIKWGIKNPGTTTIVLTPHQRALVKAETGLLLEQIALVDEGGNFMRTMSNTTPDQMNIYILEHARKMKIEGEARERARVELENQFSYLESLSPEHAAMVAKVKAQPSFQKYLKK